MSTGHQVVKQRYDFLHAAKTSLPMALTDNVIVSSLANGALLFTAAAAGDSTLDFADNGIPMADWLSFEAVMKFDAIDADLDVRCGIASLTNADPDAIPESAMFGIKGNGVGNVHRVFVETDDGTRDLSQDTDKQVRIDEWQRFRIDFATGIQSVSAPAFSKGGFGSVRFSTSRQSAGNNFMEHVTLQEQTLHMDMSDATGPLQPFVQVRMLGAPAGANLVQLKEICIEYRAW